MDLPPKAAVYPAGQFPGLQGRIFRSQLLQKIHHIRIQFVRAPRPGLLRRQRRQAPRFQHAEGIMDSLAR